MAGFNYEEYAITTLKTAQQLGVGRCTLDAESINALLNLVEKRVEIVRCADCAVPHNSWLGCPNLNGLIPLPNHFCGFGVRKEK